MDREIFIGKFGGRYWVDDSGKKHYMKRTVQKSVDDDTEKQFITTVLRNYNGRAECMYTETINAKNIDDAREILQDLYRRHGSYSYSIQSIKQI